MITFNHHINHDRRPTIAPSLHSLCLAPFYALFEICSWKGSKTVIDAIVINFSKMMQALLLGLLFMYTWMVLGMVTLRAQHGEDLCSNMFQCFFMYVISSRFVHSPP